MNDQDIGYYLQRAMTERRLAFQASRADVAAIHDELAKQYQALAEQGELRAALKAGTPLRIWA